MPSSPRQQERAATPGARPLSQLGPSVVSEDDRVIGKQVDTSKQILFAALFLPEAGLSVAGVAQESQQANKFMSSCIWCQDMK